MVAVPAANWAGWYAGVSLGANWQQAHVSDDYQQVQGASATNSGFIGGGQVGYNWQNGNAVYGWEADISGLSGNPSVTNYGYGYNGNHLGTTSSKIEWLSTFRARMGLAVGNAMAYATGGLAVGGVKTSLVTTAHGGTAGDNTNTRVGWTVGAGVEQKIGTNWTVGLEGLFVDLGKKDQSVSYATGKTAAAVVNARNNAFIGRFKANYKF